MPRFWYFGGMDRNGFIVVFLTFMIAADLSSASFAWNFRKVISVTKKDSTDGTQITPLPSTVSGAQKSNPSQTDSDKFRKEKLKDPQVTKNSSTVDRQVTKNSSTVHPQGTNNSSTMHPQGTNNSSNMDPNSSNNNNKTGSANPSTDKKIDIGKNHEGEEKGDNTTNSQLGSNGSCKGSPKTKRCMVPNTMLACIQTSENGSKELAVLVQNEGRKTLKVNLTIQTSVWLSFEISNNQTKKINNISLTLGKSTKIVLNAGNGECVLHVDPPKSEGNFLNLLSFYSKQLTPIYGAYFLFLVALFFGGTWACCKLRKRRSQGGVPYQELEMGLPESSTAVDVDTAEGWDEHWDDDWDEDKAVKSPGGLHVGSISANGLTSRSSKRDGWEVDWDD